MFCMNTSYADPSNWHYYATVQNNICDEKPLTTIKLSYQI